MKITVPKITNYFLFIIAWGMLILVSSVQAQSLDSALRADPYFAQKLKMQLQQDRYAQVKSEYEQRKAKPKPSTQNLRYKNKEKSPTIDYRSQSKWRHKVQHNPFKHRALKLGFKVKYDVRFDGMDPKWYDFLPRIRHAFGHFTPTITSATDGRHHKHGKYSHYTGHKLDIRVKNIPGVRIRGKRITRGRDKIMVYVNKLNRIPGIKAVLEDRTTFPHIDILVEY